MKTKKFLVLALLAILTLVVSACAAAPTAGVPGAAPAEPAAGEAAASASEGEFTTPHPILSDVKVRTAIANCIDRAALIQASYDYVDDPSQLEMDSFLPKTHWAYSGPYDFPKFDPEAGKALLDEAGWTQEEGAPVRTNANGDALSLKFTTTNAQFRQTWSAVAIQQLADCGIQIIPTYAPASWWFGDTTGLNRRDYELGAYAWVGEAEPGGRSLYSCDQIPTPANNWQGQNTMGWCNEAASNAIIKGNNTLLREDRIPQYDIVQKEFAKDVVSIPIFQRAEVEAWSANLEGPAPDPTDYTTWNIETWKLADGGDTIVLGMTQEPDSMWQAASSMAASAQLRKLMGDTGGGDNARIFNQVNYDFQPGRIRDQLSMIEAGLATNNDIEVKAGDMVYDITGQPVTLEQGVKVFDKDGNEVEYDGTSPLTMKQLVVTYPFKGYTWSDGEPGKVADFELAYKIDCDKSGGALGYVNCDTIQKMDFATDKLEYTTTYLPGVQSPTYFNPIFGPYPSHQVLSDGRNLADVPAAEWATLPEIAEKPLSYGPYMVTDWTKGQSITFAQNPYFAGDVATPNVIAVFVADTNQAVAQLLNGDVDFLDKSTLGAGAEPKTVIEAAKGGAPIKYDVITSPTWEHIDINMYVK